jgi:hypothetical protein
MHKDYKSNNKVSSHVLYVFSAVDIFSEKHESHFERGWEVRGCCSFGGGAYQHCSHEDILYSNPPIEFRHSPPEALHTKRA